MLAVLTSGDGRCVNCATSRIGAFLTVTTKGSVLFDSQVFANQRHGGVSRYFNALMTSLSRRGHWQPLLHAGIHFAQTVAAADAKRVGLNVHVPMRRPRGIRYAQALNRYLSPSPDRFDGGSLIYHPTWYDADARQEVSGYPDGDHHPRSDA